MSAIKVEVELPQDLVVALNVDPSTLGQRVKEWTLLELFQEGVISAGKAAEILGTSKEGFIALLNLHGLPYLVTEPEELSGDLEVALKAGSSPEAA